MKEMLKRDINLEKIEQDENWGDICKYLYERWASEKTNQQFLLRLGTECWYILTFWERIPHEKNPYPRDFFSGLLTGSKLFGFDELDDDPTFLCLYAYMIKLFPYWFDDFNCDFDKTDSDVHQMLKKAHVIEPASSVPVYLMGCLLNEDTNEYRQSKVCIREKINCLFPGSSLVDIYFKNVWR